jgi:hypothetical protein
MMGDHVSAESLTALGGSQQNSQLQDEDALEGAEHARLLVEDCRRMLLGGSQLPIGAWGLIGNLELIVNGNSTVIYLLAKIY